MSFFIAVLFFCMGDQCVFYKEDEIFNDEKSCQKVVMERFKELQAQGVQSRGVCMEMIMGKPA